MEKVVFFWDTRMHQDSDVKLCIETYLKFRHFFCESNILRKFNAISCVNLKNNQKEKWCFLVELVQNESGYLTPSQETPNHVV